MCSGCYIREPDSTHASPTMIFTHPLLINSDMPVSATEALWDPLPGLPPTELPALSGYPERDQTRTVKPRGLARACESLGAQKQTEHMRNTTPCVKCGYVYSWTGTAEEIAQTLEATEFQCPACYNNLPSPGNPRGLASSAARKGTRRRAQHSGWRKQRENK